MCATLDGKSYNGVLTQQWDPEGERKAMTFTALGRWHRCVGARQLDRSDKEIVDAVQKDLSLGDVSGVFYDLDLPSEASGGAVIRWSSSHSQVVSAEGKVQRPLCRGRGREGYADRSDYERQSEDFQDL